MMSDIFETVRLLTLPPFFRLVEKLANLLSAKDRLFHIRWRIELKRNILNIGAIN